MGKLKIIIDTNLWISFLITKNFSKLDQLLNNRRCILLFSEELLKEFLEVAMRPKFHRFFTEEHIQLALEIIEVNGLFVSTNSIVNACRDAKDNYLLSLAIDGNADYLLTSDKDLLVLNKIGNTYIKTISEFIEKNLT